MKIGRFTLSGVSSCCSSSSWRIVSTIAAKYLYQRWRCPRVWTRAAAVDPNCPCAAVTSRFSSPSTAAKARCPRPSCADFPRDVSGAIKPGPYVLRPQAVSFRANLKVVNNKLVAVRPEGQEDRPDCQARRSRPARRALRPDAARSGVDFFIADTAQSPLPLKPGQELWIEVTVPPNRPAAPDPTRAQRQRRLEAAGVLE